MVNLHQESKPRDFQRERVYRAEKELHWHHRGDWMDDILDCQAFAMQVTADPAVRRRYAWRPHLHEEILIEPGRPNQKRALCFVRESRITLPPLQRRPLWILHEIGHALLPDWQLHREDFVECYAFLIRRFQGLTAAAAFGTACREHRVKGCPCPA